MSDSTWNELVSKLRSVAELEHQFMCQYLFSAFSIQKRYVEQQALESITPAQLEMTRRWANTVYSVARQEMEHLALVNNLLRAIGAAPCFARLNIEERPLEQFHLGAEPCDGSAERLGGALPGGVDCADLAPIPQPFAFTPFTRDAVARWTCMESPGCEALLESVPGDFADWCFENIHVVADRKAADASPDDVEPGTISAAYDAISDLFSQLPSSAFVAGADEQVKLIQQYDIYVFPVTDNASAQQAIDLITKQGESNRASTNYESHYRRFYEITREFDAALELTPGFQPYWDVGLPADGGTIGNAYTRGIYELCNDAYGNLLVMLTGLYGTLNQQPGSSPYFAPALGQESFSPFMTMVLRSLAEVLVQLDPGGGVAGAQRLGPGFYIDPQLQADLLTPYVEGSSGVLKPVFGDIEDILARTRAFDEKLASVIAMGPPPVLDPNLSDWVTGRLNFIQENSRRITVNLARIYEQGIFSAFDSKDGY
ncbi:MAG: ferritin-like domain-containing protein [Gammaproteobacteria bacterium]